MTMANEHRGEVTLELEGVQYVLRPTYEAILAFEKATGKSLIQLAMAAEKGELSLSELASVVTECIRAWGRQTGEASAKGANPEKIATLIYGAGVMKVVPRVAVVLAMAAMGGVTQTGEPKAVEATTGQTSTAS